MEMGSENMDVKLKERERCAKIAALFVHRRLYEADMPACSYHSRDIYDAVMNMSDEELSKYEYSPPKVLI
jgi:hypothetical protein